MPQNRTAEERLLSLLREQAFPMEVREIAHALGWSRQRALQVLGRCIGNRPPLVLRIWGEPRGEGAGAGRPGAAFASACQPRALRALQADGLRVLPDMVVLTPLERRARVVSVNRQGFVDLRYLDAQPGEEACAVAHHRLLRPYQAGRVMPARSASSQGSLSPTPPLRLVA